MESSVSLFNMLLKKCKNSSPADITIDEVKDLSNNVRQFDREGYELLFVLIKSYSLMENQDGEIPYEGQRINENKMSDSNDGRVCDINFDVRKFTPLLRKILFEFSKLHLQEMEVRKKMLSERKPF